MKIERLDNGQVVLSVSKQQEYIQIKKYERYGDTVEKATISAITEDMYVDWEVSSAYQDNITGFLQSVRDCCQYDIYTKEDIEKYQGFIERQNEFEKIEPSNKYYDNRVVNGLDRKFDSSKLIAYDVSNPQIPQKSKRFPFWIEVHTIGYTSLHICFRADIVKLLGEHIHFILDTKSKDVILEACRVFAALEKNLIQKLLKFCSDLQKIAKAFSLNPDEYEIDEPSGEINSYQIFPKHGNTELIINEIYSPRIFNLYNLTMRKCVFEYGVKLIKETVIDTAIKKNITFRECFFKEGVFIGKMRVEKKIIFENCVFDKIMHGCCAYFEDTIFLERASFQESTFKNPVSFINSTFKDKAFFSLATFEKSALFVETTFEDNAYFDNTIFKDRANFQAGEFHKNARFYETVFKKMPIFIQAIFNGNINLTNTELDFGFDGVKHEIEETYNKRKEKYDREQDKEDKEEPRKYKIANEFRDSFRNFKAVLIEHHNMLDASNYHRVELYLKEIELEYRNFGLRDFVDRIQLYCYRITSDHHTNLLLILTNVLALIVFFGAAATALFCRANDLQKKIRVGRECCEPEQSHYLLATFPEHIIDYIFPKNLAVWGEILAIIILCVVFVYAFISIVRFIHQIDTEKLHCCFKFFCLPTLIILAVKPAIMLPIFGKLIDESLKIDFPAFTSLSIVYAILMFLLIWSLQKTARKNTIVPN